MPQLRASHGQASVEAIALLPVLVAVALAVLSVLAAGAASEAANAAAEAGAVALLQDADAEQAARATLTGWPRRNLRVKIRGRRIDVAVRPRLPIGALAGKLTARATAHAGPSSAPAVPESTRGGDGTSSRPPHRVRAAAPAAASPVPAPGAR